MLLLMPHAEQRCTVKDKTMAQLKLKGIDVSHHQGGINWQTVKNSGIDFAIVRVGYSNRNGKGGLCFDKRYDYNLKQCNKLGIPVGVYIYCYDTTPEAATITVKALMKVVKRYNIEYPVIYDIEYDNEKFSKDTNTAICKAAMKVIEDEKYYGMIYASRDFFVNHLNMSALTGSDKWEAAYRSVDDNVVCNSMWQYSSKGHVPGIVGDVDLDYSYRDYPSIIKKAGLNGFAAVESVKEVLKQAETVTKPNPEPRVIKPNLKTVIANRLNVRYGPSTDSSVAKVLEKGTKVNVLKESNGWSLIGEDHWVMSKFIQ